jgi:hypothetical protein
MAKPATIAEIKNALEPLSTLLRNVDNKVEINNEHFSTLVSMCTGLQKRLDALEQTLGGVEVATVTKKPATKKTTKKTTVEETKESSEEKPVKRTTVKKTTAKKATTEEPEEEPEEKTVEEPPQPPQVKKSAPKKITKKPITLVKPVAKAINKMTFFKNMCDEDPEYFAQYITSKVKKAIAAENEESWTSLSEEDLKKEKQSAYYQFMCKKHDSELQNLKNSYLEQLAKDKMVVVDKEE